MSDNGPHYRGVVAEVLSVYLSVVWVVDDAGIEGMRRGQPRKTRAVDIRTPARDGAGPEMLGIITPLPGAPFRTPAPGEVASPPLWRDLFGSF